MEQTTRTITRGDWSFALVDFSQAQLEAYEIELLRLGRGLTSSACMRRVVVQAAMVAGIIRPTWTAEQLAEAKPAMITWLTPELTAHIEECKTVPKV
jgi:hypothetical protein